MANPAREAALVAEAREGDRRAFDQLARANLERVYSLLFRMVGNHEDAEDLAQEAMVRAWNSLSYYRGDSRFSTWLFRIAMHIARDHHRRRYRVGLRRIFSLGEESGEETPPSVASGPSERLHGKELEVQLASAIQELPHRFRAALVLRVFEEMDYAEIGRINGTTLGTARTHVMKARRLLERRLGPWLEDDR